MRLRDRRSVKPGSGLDPHLEQDPRLSPLTPAATEQEPQPALCAVRP